MGYSGVGNIEEAIANA